MQAQKADFEQGKKRLLDNGNKDFVNPKEKLYDKFPLTVHQMDIIIGVLFALIALFLVLGVTHTSFFRPVRRLSRRRILCEKHPVKENKNGTLSRLYRPAHRGLPRAARYLTLLTHDVSGAAVLLVENEDVNKAFGIGFGTFPSDDTGVFHILEHSVLAGSEKIPGQLPLCAAAQKQHGIFPECDDLPG